MAVKNETGERFDYKRGDKLEEGAETVGRALRFAIQNGLVGTQIFYTLQGADEFRAALQSLLEKVNEHPKYNQGNVTINFSSVRENWGELENLLFFVIKSMNVLSWKELENVCYYANKHISRFEVSRILTGIQEHRSRLLLACDNIAGKFLSYVNISQEGRETYGEIATFGTLLRNFKVAEINQGILQAAQLDFKISSEYRQGINSIRLEYLNLLQKILVVLEKLSKSLEKDKNSPRELTNAVNSALVAVSA